MPLVAAQLDQLRQLATERTEDVVSLAQRICAVSAPTGQERTRAEFVATLLQERGYKPEIDEIGNVYTHRGTRGQGPYLMLLAHTDTVFPLDTPIILSREGDIVRGPGIGDNSLSVAAMISLLDILDELQIETPVDIIAVADVGEEGLGNLRGARAAVERYQHELGAVLVIDGRFGYIVNAAVGSKRWRITVTGPGGHSYGSFGTPSAIHGLGKIIAAIADLKVPVNPRTTFNVGMIEGGTSVNTIAAQASAIVDLRSTDIHVLDELAEQIRSIVQQRADPGLKTEITVLGERPAGQCEPDNPLVQCAVEVLRWLGIEPRLLASSTDANVPISLHIPSVCVGVTQGENAHTLDEYIHIGPIPKGLAQIVRLSLEACEIIKK